MMSDTSSTKTIRLMDVSKSSTASMNGIEVLNEISDDQDNSTDAVFKVSNDVSSAQENSSEISSFTFSNEADFADRKRSIAGENDSELPNKRMRVMSPNNSVESDNSMPIGNDLTLDTNNTCMTGVNDACKCNGDIVSNVFDKVDASDEGFFIKRDPAPSQCVQNGTDDYIDELDKRLCQEKLSECNLVLECGGLPFDDLMSQWSQYINGVGDTDTVESVSVPGKGDSRSQIQNTDLSVSEGATASIDQIESECTDVALSNVNISQGLEGFDVSGIMTAEYKQSSTDKLFTEKNDCSNGDSCKQSLQVGSEECTSTSAIIDKRQNCKQTSNSFLDGNKVDQELNSLVEFLSHTGNSETILDDEISEISVKETENNTDSLVPEATNYSINNNDVSANNKLNYAKRSETSHCMEDSDTAVKDSAQHIQDSASAQPPCVINIIPEVDSIDAGVTADVLETETEFPVIKILSTSNLSSSEVNGDSFRKVHSSEDESVEDGMNLCSSSSSLSADIITSTVVTLSKMPSSYATDQSIPSGSKSGIGSDNAVDKSISADFNTDFVNNMYQSISSDTNKDTENDKAFDQTVIYDRKMDETATNPAADCATSGDKEIENTGVNESCTSRAVILSDGKESVMDISDDYDTESAPELETDTNIYESIGGNNIVTCMNCQSSTKCSCREFEVIGEGEATCKCDTSVEAYLAAEVAENSLQNYSSNSLDENISASGDVEMSESSSNNVLKIDFMEESPSTSTIITIKSDASCHTADGNSVVDVKDLEADLASKDDQSITITQKKSASDVASTVFTSESIETYTISTSDASFSANSSEHPVQSGALTPGSGVASLALINLSNISKNFSAVSVASPAMDSANIQSADTTLSQIARPVVLVENYNKVLEDRAIVKLLSNVGSILATHCYVVGNARDTLEVLDGEPREAAVKKLDLIKSAAKPYICRARKICGCGFRDCLQNVIEWHRDHAYVNKQANYQCCVCKSDKNLVVQFRSPAFLKYHMYSRHDRVLLFASGVFSFQCPFCSFGENNFKIFRMHIAYCRKSFVLNKNLEPRASVWDFTVAVTNKITPMKNVLIPGLLSGGKVCLSSGTALSRLGIASTAVSANPLLAHRPILPSTTLPISSSPALPRYHPVTLVAASSFTGSAARAPTLGNVSQQPYRWQPYRSTVPSNHMPLTPRPVAIVPQPFGSPVLTTTFRPPPSSPAPRCAAVGSGPVMSCPLCKINFTSVQMLMKHAEMMHSQIWAAAQNILLQQGNPQANQVHNVAGAMARTIVIEPIPEPSVSGLQNQKGNKLPSPASKLPSPVNKINKSASPGRKPKKVQPTDSFLCWVCKKQTSGDKLQHLAVHGFTLWHMLMGFRCYMCLKACRTASGLEKHMLSYHRSVFKNVDELWTQVYEHIPQPCLTAMELPEYSKINALQKCIMCRRYFMAVHLLRHGCIDHDWVPKMAKIDDETTERQPPVRHQIHVSFKCCLCVKTFSLNADYVKHVKEAHLRPCKIVVKRLDKFTYAKYILKYAGLQVSDNDLLKLSIESCKSDLVNGKSKEGISYVQPSISRRTSNVSSDSKSREVHITKTGLVRSLESRKSISYEVAQKDGSTSVPSSSAKRTSVSNANAGQGAKNSVESAKRVVEFAKTSSTCAITVIDDDTDEDDCVIVDSRPGKGPVKVSTSHSNVTLQAKATSQVNTTPRTNVTSHVNTTANKTPYSNATAQAKSMPQVNTTSRASTTPQINATSEPDKTTQVNVMPQISKTSEAPKTSQDNLKSQSNTSHANTKSQDDATPQNTTSKATARKKMRPGPRCRTRHPSVDSNDSVTAISESLPSKTLSKKTLPSETLSKETLPTCVVKPTRSSSPVVVMEIDADLPEPFVSENKCSVTGSIIDDMPEKSPIPGLLASCFVDLGDKIKEQAMKRRRSGRIKSVDVDKSGSGSELSSEPLSSEANPRRRTKKKSPLSLLGNLINDLGNKETRRNKENPVAEPVLVLDPALCDPNRVIIIKPSCDDNDDSN